MSDDELLNAMSVIDEAADRLQQLPKENASEDEIDTVRAALEEAIEELRDLVSKTLKQRRGQNPANKD